MGSLEEVLSSALLRVLCFFFLACEVEPSMWPVWWTHFFDDWQGRISSISSILAKKGEDERAAKRVINTYIVETNRVCALTYLVHRAPVHLTETHLKEYLQLLLLAQQDRGFRILTVNTCTKLRKRENTYVRPSS